MTMTKTTEIKLNSRIDWLNAENSHAKNQLRTARDSRDRAEREARTARYERDSARSDARIARMNTRDSSEDFFLFAMIAGMFTLFLGILIGASSDTPANDS